MEVFFMIIAVHVIDNAGIPKLSVSLKDEVIEPELMSAIVTTLRTLTESLTQKKELESFTIAGTQFFAVPAGENIVVIATNKYDETDKIKLDELIKLVSTAEDLEKIKGDILKILKKRIGLREKSKQWADEVWG